MNVFILGAGFSKPAGLPLGAELFSDVIRHAKYHGSYQNTLEQDINSFLKYCREAKGNSISEKDINFEEFISYLDIEHLLHLQGSDHWSSEGNRSQLIIRNLIALVLHMREIAITDEAFSLYEEFAERLEPGDWIFTFNYDTIVEKALKKKNRPYRLVQERYQEIHFGGGTPAEEIGEIVLLKMHGSINWFNKSHYLGAKEYLKRWGWDINPHNAVFDGRKQFDLRRLVEDPYPQESTLRNVYILENLSEYFDNSNHITEVPLIVSPSFSKLIYLNPLSEFWAGFSKSGEYEKRVAVIGFSLPAHDEYISQPLYWFIHNFQNYESPVAKKAKLKIIDLKENEEEIAKYKATYKFVDWDKTDAYFGGFSRDALDIIFSDS